MARPCKYETHVKPKFELIECWARDGLTDEQIAHNLGISVDSYYTYKKNHKEFSDTLKKGKEVVDYEVENALLKKSLGYNATVEKTFKLKRVVYSAEGRKIEEYEELVTGFDEVHIPADTTAQIFWLKNRKPSVWRDKQVERESNSVDETKELIEKIKGDEIY